MCSEVYNNFSCIKSTCVPSRIFKYTATRKLLQNVRTMTISRYLNKQSKRKKQRRTKPVFLKYIHVNKETYRHDLFKSTTWYTYKHTISKKESRQVKMFPIFHPSCRGWGRRGRISLITLIIWFHGCVCVWVGGFITVCCFLLSVEQ